MKKIIKISLLLFGIMFFISCEKDEEKTTLNKTIASNVLEPLTASEFVLIMDNASTTFQTFQWNEPQYGFAAAVTYTLQVDVKGNDFASVVDITTITKGEQTSVTVGDFNKSLLDLGLEPDINSTIQIRVKSWISDSVAIIYSNVLEAKVTPYATSFPPIYMCGAATGGWSWDKSVEVRSSAASIYSTTAYFISNEAFRFFKQKDWSPTSYNYPYFSSGSVDALFENANDGDSNFKFIGSSGYYTITVNLKTKVIQMLAVEEPLMYMIGSAVNGWDTGTAIKMTWLSDGVFYATTTFTNAGAFRFFAQKDWGPTSYNYPYFADGSVDALFENAADGDSNFKFVGTTGSYKITLNMLTKTITMEQPIGR